MANECVWSFATLICSSGASSSYTFAYSITLLLDSSKAYLVCYSCPLDYVKVYDGLDNTSAVIGTYCGQQRNLVLYSSESSLYVLFVTLERTANTQNRGFKGIFEFSESFVKLGKSTQRFFRSNAYIHTYIYNTCTCTRSSLSTQTS